MHLGVARFGLRIAQSHSLKQKRMVVQSVIQRVRNRFNAAVAEIDTQDNYQIATIGVVCLSNDPRHASEMIEKVIDFVEAERLDADIIDVETELIGL